MTGISISRKNVTTIAASNLQAAKIIIKINIGSGDLEEPIIKPHLTAAQEAWSIKTYGPYGDLNIQLLVHQQKSSSAVGTANPRMSQRIKAKTERHLQERADNLDESQHPQLKNDKQPSAPSTSKPNVRTTDQTSTNGNDDLYSFRCRVASCSKLFASDNGLKIHISKCHKETPMECNDNNFSELI
ncbi:hypothetical protein Bhyg_08384, partial [Pseudolycoriella hygida]